MHLIPWFTTIDFVHNVLHSDRKQYSGIRTGDSAPVAADFGEPAPFLPQRAWRSD